MDNMTIIAQSPHQQAITPVGTMGPALAEGRAVANRAEFAASAALRYHYRTLFVAWR